MSLALLWVVSSVELQSHDANSQGDREEGQRVH